jgi:ABC-2 type transport system permease protein
MVICDQDVSQVSRHFVSKFAHTEYFDLKYHVGSMGEIKRLLDRGQAKIGIFIPRGFAQRVESGETAYIQVIVDGSDNNAANIAMTFISKIIGNESVKSMNERLTKMPGLPPAGKVEPRLRVWYNPDLKNINYMLPGLIGLILILMTLMLTAAAIVRERERGTLEQVIVSPIRRYEFILGKIIPFIIVGFIDVLLVIIVGTLWFNVPLRGSLLLLFALATLFISTNLGFGLLISTVSRTQAQAMSTAFFMLMPSMILSGFLFPVENMPRVVQVVSYVIPLTYFLQIVRGIFLKGSGFSVLWPQAAVLAAMGAAIISLSIVRFQKKLGD